VKIIDIPTHVYPDAIAEKAAESIRDYYHLGDNMDGTVGTLLQRGKEAGVSQFLILPVAEKPDHVQSINNFILRQTKEHDCFVGFGAIHPEMHDPADGVEQILSLGLKGIKIHPDCQKFAIDDPRMYPVYEAAQGRLPLMVHMGDERLNFSHPMRLRKILKLFPGLEVCAAHFGGHTMYESARENLSDTSCIMDISSTMMFLEKGKAEDYINHYGAERLAFGTDYPVWDPVHEVQRLMELNITMEQKEQIAWKTAAAFLNL